MLVQGHFRSILVVTGHVAFRLRCPPLLYVRSQMAMLHYFLLKIAVICLVASLANDTTAWAESALVWKFNGPEKKWQLLPSQTPVQIVTQDVVSGGVRDTAGYERITVAAALGQTAFLVCPIEHVAVLDELQARMWINATRPDLQIAMRVVLPRSLDLQKQSVATTIVRGSAYSRPGNWQELHVADVPRLLADQVRVMRATPGASIDPKEAYVDAIVLLVPGNPNGTEIGTDDLAIDGVLMPAAHAIPGAPTTTKQTHGKGKEAGHASTIAIEKPREAVPERMSSALRTTAVRMQGSVLTIDGRAFLPRAIESNGEPLAFLASCGFNVVQLSTAPTAAQSEEAAKLGLWLLCPPPKPDALAQAGVGRLGDRVLAWLLQDDALEVDTNYAMRWAEAVRERDAVFGRPVVIMPQSNWAAINEAADILIASNPRSGAVRPLEFEAWLEGCSLKAQPGMPLWVGISTQADEAVRRQVAMLTRMTVPSLIVDPQQIESHVQLACAHSVRGFVFHSGSPLNGVDDATQQRVAALQLINRRLQLIEPWLAGGNLVSQVHSVDGAELGMLLYVDRARLLMPLSNEGGRARPNREGVYLDSKVTDFIIPGVPETSQVFYFTPMTMRTLHSERIAGGTKVSIPVAGDGYVVMTEDARIIQSLQQRIARDSSRTVQLERDLSARRARAFAYATQRLIQVGFNSEIAAREAAAVNQQLAQVDSHLAAGRAEQAHVATGVLTKLIESSISEQRAALMAPAILESNPLAVFSDTMPELASLERSLTTLRPGNNVLMGGDFEDVRKLGEYGWQHFESAKTTTHSSAQLSSAQAHQGAYCLELNATAESHNARSQVAGSLVSIVSPPVPVEPEKLIEITGWVRVDNPFVRGEGIEISDTLGGSGLTLLVSQTSDWQPFRMIRVAAEPTQMRIFFTLTGIGAAKVDAVMVRMMEQPIARRLPPATIPPDIATTTSVEASRASGPGLAAPPTR